MMAGTMAQVIGTFAVPVQHLVVTKTIFCTDAVVVDAL